MTQFAWKAVDARGASTRGVLDADSLNAATEQLKAKGLMVLELKDRSKTANRELSLSFGGKVKLADLAIMSRQLSTMINSGMPILRALTVIQEQTENKTLSAALRDAAQRIEAGASFSDALEQHPKCFDELFVSMVRAGEAGGVLESALDRVASQLEASEQLRRQVKSAMTYPIVIFTFAGLVLLAMLTFIVPQFTNMFKDLGGELPAITKGTVAASDFVKQRWYIVFGGLFGTVYLFRRWKSSPAGRERWQDLGRRAPFKIGDIVQKVAIARWSRTLAALTGAGVPLLQALEVTGKVSGSIAIERTMENVIENVRSGGTIVEPVRESGVFPTMVSHMIAVGEETAQLETMLNKIADFYDDQVAAAIKSLTSILEPIMLIVIGGIVGFVVISMYMPMFSIYKNIQ
ncbi:MAG: type II secretion system F family protein [Patulibacter sp.]